MIFQDSELIQELRQQYAECVQELEKTKSMLKIQKEINICTLKEKEQFQNDQRMVQHEYGNLKLISRT